MAPKLKRFRIEILSKRSNDEDIDDEEFEPLTQPFDIRANNVEEAFRVAHAQWEALFAEEAFGVDLSELGPMRRQAVAERVNRLLLEIRHDTEYQYW